MRVMICEPIGEGLTWKERLLDTTGYHKTVEMLQAQGHTVVQSPFSYIEPEGANYFLWALGKAIQIMSEVDAVYFMDGWEKDRQCRLEYEACVLYGKIPMNNTEFNITNLFEFASQHYPEMVDWGNRRCQICGRRGASAYNMRVCVKVDNLGEWRFTERKIFLCDYHKNIADERIADYMEPPAFAVVFNDFATTSWEKMSEKKRKILYHMTKSLLAGYEAKYGQPPK